MAFAQERRPMVGIVLVVVIRNGRPSYHVAIVKSRQYVIWCGRAIERRDQERAEVGGLRVKCSRPRYVTCPCRSCNYPPRVMGTVDLRASACLKTTHAI